MFLLILFKHDPLALGLESHIYFSNMVIDCSKVQQNATQLRNIGRSPNLGENKLQTPNSKYMIFFAFVKKLSNKGFHLRTHITNVHVIDEDIVKVFGESRILKTINFNLDPNTKLELFCFYS